MFFVNSLTVIIKILQKNAYGNKKSLARARDFSVKLTPCNTPPDRLGLDQA